MSNFNYGSDFFTPLSGQLLTAVGTVLPLAIPILVAVIAVNFGTRWFRGTIGG